MAEITYHFNVNNVNVEAYNCNDASCSSVSAFSGSFPDGQSTTNGQIKIRYPSTLATPHGYAIFYFSPTYLPKGGLATWHTFGDPGLATADFSVDFEQAANCHSTVDSFSVTNENYPNQPIVVNMLTGLDATTHSAFTQTGNIINYVPPAYKDDYFSADTRVVLNIYNGSTLVNTQTKNLVLYQDTSQGVSFSWTPTSVGVFRAELTTTVTDNQCSSGGSQSTAKNFTVSPALPTDECYTLVNRLNTSDPYPIVVDTVNVFFDKISNYADNGNALSPVSTNVDYQIKERDTGSVVYSMSTNLAANPNTVDPVQHTFSWTPTAPGWYTISVLGVAESSLCTGKNNPTDYIEEEIYVKPVPTYNITFQVVDSDTGNDLPGATTTIGSQSAVTDSTGTSMLTGLANGVYTYTVSAPGYTTQTDTVEIAGSNVIELVSLTKANTAPICNVGGGIPDVQVLQNGVFTGLDLDDYVMDQESADALLTVSFTGNSKVSVAVDSGHVATFTPALDFSGTETVTFTFTDEGGLSCSDAVAVVVQEDTTPQLNVSSITCFPHMVASHNQSCSIFVNSDGQSVPGATVTVNYLSGPKAGETFGSCVTDTITGGCEVQDVIELDKNGTHTVYATVTKPGFKTDDDTYPRFTFEALRLRYLITDFAIYNDPEYLNPDNDFFRGEDMYIRFRVQDTEDNFVYVPNIVTASTLVSAPGGRADLTEFSGLGEPFYYYYKLTPIPISHQFLGDSDVFAFAFNFTDGSGGQHQLSLTIRNNPPMIVGEIPDLHTRKNVPTSLDLSPYEFDVEDKGVNLSWSVSGNSGAIFDARVVGKTLFIDPVFNKFGSESIVVTLTDLDGGSDSQDVLVTVDSETDESVTVAIDADPLSGAAPLDVDFKAIIFSGNGPFDVRWDFDGDGTTDARGSQVSNTFLEKGFHVVTLTVVDADGDVGTATVTIEVTKGVPEMLSRRRMKMNQLRFVNGDSMLAGDMMETLVTFKNDDDHEIENARITVVILGNAEYALGARRAIGPFDVGPNEEVTKRVLVEIPYWAQPGYYDVRVTLSNDDLRRVIAERSMQIVG